MSALDLAIIAVAAISMIVGFARGFIREVLSLVSWAAALLLAYLYYGQAGEWLVSQVENPQLRAVLAFAALFVVSLFAFTALGYFLHKGLVKEGVKGTDRLLGAVFGAARGAVVVIALLLVAGMTALPKERYWQDSQLLPKLRPALEMARGMLPRHIADKLPPV